MFTIVIYRYDNDRTWMVDRAVGGFATQDEALDYANTKIQYVPGQDFSVIEVEHFEMYEATKDFTG